MVFWAVGTLMIQEDWSCDVCMEVILRLPRQGSGQGAHHLHGGGVAGSWSFETETRSKRLSILPFSVKKKWVACQMLQKDQGNLGLTRPFGYNHSEITSALGWNTLWGQKGGKAIKKS